jgi:hypothetical protein
MTSLVLNEELARTASELQNHVHNIISQRLVCVATVDVHQLNIVVL